MPLKLDGISLCRQLRSQGYRMPILLLTARDNTTPIKITGQMLVPMIMTQALCCRN